MTETKGNKALQTTNSKQGALLPKTPPVPSGVEEGEPHQAEEPTTRPATEQDKPTERTPLLPTVVGRLEEIKLETENAAQSLFHIGIPEYKVNQWLSEKLRGQSSLEVVSQSKDNFLIIKGKEGSSVWVEARVANQYTYRQLYDLVEKLSPLRGDNKTRILFLASIEDKTWKGSYTEAPLSFAALVGSLQRLAANRAPETLQVFGIDFTPATTWRHQLSQQALEQLSKNLPKGWQASLEAVAHPSPERVVIKLRASDDTEVLLYFELRKELAPREVKTLSTEEEALVWVAPTLSARTQELLHLAQQNYLDTNGNIFISLQHPAFLIITFAKEESKNPKASSQPSLKGAKAARVVRALCDFKEGSGVREIATKAGVDAGYTSKILTSLEKDAFLQRATRGVPKKVRWGELLHRWAQDYELTKANRVVSYLEPRGTSTFFEKIKKTSFRYAVTGSFGAAQVAPFAPPRLVICYVDSPEEAAKTLELRKTETGANIWLAEPFDAVVYERRWQKDGVYFAALSQLVVDLLTSPGRSPQEAEELLSWMKEHQDDWRT